MGIESEVSSTEGSTATMRVLLTASKQLRIIGAVTSANGMQSPKSPPLLPQSLLAWIMHKDLPLEQCISQCSTSMTAHSPELVPEDIKVMKVSTNKTRSPKKTLIERLSPSIPAPRADPQSLNNTNLTSHSMPGKFGKKSHWSLFQQISNAPAL